ncbi:hypothetical protein K8F61_13730 [Microbacterium resistens]|uniref:Antitoxin FitA-like ribbon-helix-helix domain-containing protein n=1 Tax=Microbacterium resistens TaxID=156977 RepID=A0ABY3RPE1_9MICO|nr:hypothetical protein [Microbacterium resistens]UGS25716.1 hypothetical protein K8F61_13730 [Microbacterium resistens]
MATITIRSLSDEVVGALKERARRNERSMEAEVRDLLTRIASGEEVVSRAEEDVRRQVNAHQWTVPGSRFNAWIRANPLTAEERALMDDWQTDLDEWRRIPPDEDEFEDPWERAERHVRQWRTDQEPTAREDPRA